MTSMPIRSGDQATAQPYYVRDRQDWAVAQERQRHNQALFQVGEYAMFVLMWHVEDHEAGLVARCTRCSPRLDPVQSQIADTYKQPEQHKCPACYGTSFEGGYKARIIRPAIFSDADEDEQRVARGVTNPQALSVESTTDFRVRTMDYVFRSTGDRFQLRVPNRITLRTGFATPHQSSDAIGYNHARASQEDRTSVAYLIPPTEAETVAMLNRGARLPEDFSAVEVIRAPLIPLAND